MRRVLQGHDVISSQLLSTCQRKGNCILNISTQMRSITPKRVEGLVSIRENVSAGTNSGRGRGSRSRSRGRGSSPRWSQHFDHLTRMWDGISDRSSRSVTGTLPFSAPQGLHNSWTYQHFPLCMIRNLCTLASPFSRHKLWCLRTLFSQLQID